MEIRDGVRFVGAAMEVETWVEAPACMVKGVAHAWWWVVQGGLGMYREEVVWETWEERSPGVLLSCAITGGGARGVIQEVIAHEFAGGRAAVWQVALVARPCCEARARLW